MTKTFCNICGKELSALEQMNSYNVAITSKKIERSALRG